MANIYICVCNSYKEQIEPQPAPTHSSVCNKHEASGRSVIVLHSHKFKVYILYTKYIETGLGCRP